MYALQDTFALLDAVTAIIHPALHAAAVQVRAAIMENTDEAMQAYLEAWNCVFTGVSIIRNRECPPHRDPSTRAPWYDLLVTYGQYTNCQLGLQDIGTTLEYQSGTVVAVCANVLRHGVEHFSGDRTCYAFFMRRDVFRLAGIPAPDWMLYRDYLDDAFINA